MKTDGLIQLLAGLGQTLGVDDSPTARTRAVSSRRSRCR